MGWDWKRSWELEQGAGRAVLQLGAMLLVLLAGCDLRHDAQPLQASVSSL